MTSRKLPLIFLLIMVNTVVLSSCSVFGPVQSENVHSYVVNTVPHFPAHRNYQHGSILVSATETNPIYNTTAFAYTLQPYQIAYFGKHQWAETPTKMLQTDIVQTLQNTHYYHAVVTSAFVGGVDYILNTQLVEFKQDFTRCPSVFSIVLRAQLVNGYNGRIIAAKQFTVKMPAPRDTAYGGVLAANWGTEVILRELAEFCMRHGR